MPNKPAARKPTRTASSSALAPPADRKDSSSSAAVFDDIGPNQLVDTSEDITIVPFEDEASETTGGGGVRKSSRIKKRASGGYIKSASSRADGIAQRGKTKGRVV